ncbi:Transcriptional regulatory protein sin3 [Teratosphaeriaceae sp. CCFEE 6253]|nr:Transcriptional regulatory protein sin3 [Teratosphaeriaceae sp. CCFEE 6253]
MALDPTEEPVATELAKPTEKAIARWFEHPSTGNARGGGADVDPAEPRPRDVYKLWAGTSLYCFVRMFLTLYERLLKLKLAEPEVVAAVAHAETPKPALEIGIVDKLPLDFFPPRDVDAGSGGGSKVVTDGAAFFFYRQMLGKFRDVVRHDYEFGEVEEALRRFYLQAGFPMYAFEKMVNATSRFALQAMSGEGKEKSGEVFGLFRRDRAREATTAQAQTEYRKAVERLVKEGDLYRIDYVRHTERCDDQAQQTIAMFLTKKDDPAYYDDGSSPLDQENRWRGYIASYQTLDDTDGLPRHKLQLPLLLRNARTMGADPTSASYPPSPPLLPADRAAAAELDGSHAAATARVMARVLAARGEENLRFRIEVSRFFAKFEPETWEGWVQPWADRVGGLEGVGDAERVVVERGEVVRERLMLNHGGMRGLSREEVERRGEAFRGLVEGTGTAGRGEGGAGEGDGLGEEMEVDG